jgi:hypothetical protein
MGLPMRGNKWQAPSFAVRPGRSGLDIARRELVDLGDWRQMPVGEWTRMMAVFGTRADADIGTFDIDLAAKKRPY